MRTSCLTLLGVLLMIVLGSGHSELKAHFAELDNSSVRTSFHNQNDDPEPACPIISLATSLEPGQSWWFGGTSTGCFPCEACETNCPEVDPSCCEIKFKVKNISDNPIQVNWDYLGPCNPNHDGSGQHVHEDETHTNTFMVCGGDFDDIDLVDFEFCGVCAGTCIDDYAEECADEVFDKLFGTSEENGPSGCKKKEAEATCTCNGEFPFPE